jgi:hypothetical protein
MKKAIAGGSGLIIVAAGWAYYSFVEQINNSILLQRCAREVASAYSHSGSLPPSIQQNDRWGRPLAYFRSDKHFLLASFGCDGKPDVIDYAALLTGPVPSEPKGNCLLPWRDTVFIDEKVWEGCLK